MNKTEKIKWLKEQIKALKYLIECSLRIQNFESADKETKMLEKYQSQLINLETQT